MPRDTRRRAVCMPRAYRMLINLERLIRLVTCVGCGRDRVGLSREQCPICGHQLVAVLYSALDGQRLTRPTASCTISGWHDPPPGPADEPRTYAVA